MLDQDRYWDCLDQAHEASHRGRLDEALAWIDEALAANPNGAEALNSRGEILWDHARPDEALRDFERAIEVAGVFDTANLNRAELLIEEFREYERALEDLDEMLRDPLDAPIEAEVYYLKAKALFYQDDLEAALFLLRRAIKTNGESGVFAAFEGQILFEQGMYEDARKRLQRSLVLEPDAAHSVYHMGLVEEHLGNREAADKLFARAAQLAPDQYPLGEKIEEPEFERAAAEAIEQLPDSIRRYVRNCPILIRDLPSREMVVEANVTPQILGLFAGVPATEPGASPTFGTAQPAGPDAIFLFKRNLERAVESRDHLVVEIQTTVKHEIGHYLGFDEEELERLGLG
jgi:predicted Zn-dependent protease with MMP-like domain/predicted negative regulator of RcsB-dependent stress response